MATEQGRLASVKEGLVFALIPALLLVPGIGYFTVCPPTYADVGIRIMLAAFLACEIWALRKLLPSLNTRRDGRVDRVNLLVWAGCTFATLTSLASLGLLLIGYPKPY
jgi:hypothetical protein